MKALSIKQPWAWLICKGMKDVENRSWPTKFRGRVFIHAGKNEDFPGIRSGYVENRLPPIYWAQYNEAFPFTRGAIIGEVDIIDCKYRFPNENANLYSKWHIPGQYGFILANPVLYVSPIPYKGQLKFFEVCFN